MSCYICIPNGYFRHMTRTLFSLQEFLKHLWLDWGLKPPVPGFCKKGDCLQSLLHFNLSGQRDEVYVGYGLLYKRLFYHSDIHIKCHFLKLITKNTSSVKIDQFPKLSLLNAFSNLIAFSSTMPGKSYLDSYHWTCFLFETKYLFPIGNSF